MGQTEPQFLSDPMSDRKKSFRQFWTKHLYQYLQIQIHPETYQWLEQPTSEVILSPSEDSFREGLQKQM
jgi:hypothetical protein